MLATLLLPAGITSEASICYKDEAMLLKNADDVDSVYVKNILPDKMEKNLDSIYTFNIFDDVLTSIKTLLAVFGKRY
jgi:lipopolysaccharide/colanic/teichoic acid biosynthesis glycosyltransferase